MENKITLTELRQKIRMNKKEFAQAIGVHYLTVSRWERGVMIPRMEHIRLIEEKYKVTLNY